MTISASTEISSKGEKVRQSNIELLRLLSMLFVLVVHADYLSAGIPTQSDAVNSPLSTVTRIFIEVLAIPCVNIFVLISGWFSIKASIKGLCRLLFICVYFTLGLYIGAVLYSNEPFNLSGIGRALVEPFNYWFVDAFIALYILSPALNYFSIQASRKQFRNLLVCLYIYQTVSGYFLKSFIISYGYSVFSFAGLYLLARYVRIYRPSFCRFGNAFILCFLFGTTALIYWMTYIGLGDKTGNFLLYMNPFMILSALGTVILFSRLKIRHSRLINWASASCFAVYIFHCGPYTLRKFTTVMRQLYTDYNGIICLLMMGGALVCVFIIAILLDQPRKWLWKLIAK